MFDEGMLMYDSQERRYRIWYGMNESYPVHCGECFEVFFKGKWVRTRMEMDSNIWVLVGVCHGEFSGLRART